MIYRAMIVIILGAWLTFFVSCGSHETSRGTIDSGGGNLLNGKPLESYKKKPRDMPAFDKIVKPILATQNFPMDVLNVFNFVLDNKTWYFVPTNLDLLPSQKIGWAGNTQQGALQDFKQLKIDDTRFQAMDHHEQALLIAHELLMGLRLLKLDSALNECLILHDPKDDGSTCHNSYSKTLRGHPSELTTIDYAEIRAAAIEIVDNKTELSREDWDDLFARHGFSTKQHKFELKNSKKIISLLQLNEMIENTKTMHAWPVYGFDLAKMFIDHPDFLNPEAKHFKFDWKSDVSCENIDIRMTQNQIFIKLKDKTYSALWNNPVELRLEKDELTKRSLFEFMLPTLKLADSKIGDDLIFASLSFLGESLYSITIQKGTELAHGETAPLHSEYQVICSIEKSVKIDGDDK